MNDKYLRSENMILTGDRSETFSPEVDRFADIIVLGYRVPGFEDLSLREKELVYYLSEAALCGRDIVWDQNFRYNLLIRKTIEAILASYNGDRSSESFIQFMAWSKRVFFSNGIHHHYSGEKFVPDFSRGYLQELVHSSDISLFPLRKGEDVSSFLDFLGPLLYDPHLYPRRVDQTQGTDMISSSSNNFYEGVTQAEVEKFYAARTDADNPRPVSVGLNSKIVKRGDLVREEVYKAGGLYGPAISEVISWLGKALKVASDEKQRRGLTLLIDFYKTGDLKMWDEYNLIWAADTGNDVDYINGFIETYGDPMGMKATWEAVVNIRDAESSKRTDLIVSNARWFEEHSPVDEKYKRKEVRGVAARVINIVMLGGDCYPASPLGINLPNSNWIRSEAGSKSVTLLNITNSRDDIMRRSGFLEEFAFDRAEMERALKYGAAGDALHTDLHECIGHASGRLAPGTDPNALKNYASPLEEMRADLFALYFMTDPKLLDTGIAENEEAGKAGYDSYIRNGLLTQLARITPGKKIEQAHMRCRAAITHWVYEKGRADDIVEIKSRNGKRYTYINDYKKLRGLFGMMLKEVQRIKSEGDYEAGKRLIEDYGVMIDSLLHKEVLERYNRLNIAPYTGFVNPRIIPVKDQNDRITDVRIEYCNDFLKQVIDYGRRYSFLEPF